MYSIAITFHDKENNKLLTLGGAAWETEQEWDHAWAAIPVARDSSSHCLADKIDDEDVIVDDQDVSIPTVEALLDNPISQLIEEARAKRKMPNQLTVDDLDRALFTVKNDEGERIAVSAKDATPQQFHKWATGCVLAEDSHEQWLPEDRVGFCNVLYRHNRLTLIKKESEKG